MINTFHDISLYKCLVGSADCSKESNVEFCRLGRDLDPFEIQGSDNHDDFDVYCEDDFMTTLPAYQAYKNEFVVFL